MIGPGAMARSLNVPRPNDRCTSGGEADLARREQTDRRWDRLEKEERNGEMRGERKGNTKRGELNGGPLKGKNREKGRKRSSATRGELHGFRKRWGV